MKSVDLVFSGSGTLFVAHIGAWAKIAKHRTIEAASGTSGGAIVAAAVAFGLTPDKAMQIAEKALDGSLLDKSWWVPWRKWRGLHKGKKLHALLRKTFPGKMKDAKMPFAVWATCLHSREPVLFSSWGTPDVDVADALSASAAIWPMFEPWDIDGVPYIDGGFRVNYGTAVWDHLPGDTIGVKFEATNVDGVPLEELESVVEIIIDNANRVHQSRKSCAKTTVVKTNQNGMEFGKNAQQISELLKAGSDAADRALGAVANRCH